MTPWGIALRLADAFARDPSAVGGIRLIARAGPVRDRWLDRAGPVRRLPVGVDDDALTGGLDLAAVLATGRPVRRAGLLDTPGPLILPSAERCPPALAGRLAQALDAGRHALIALDEGEGGDGLPPVLADRLGAVVDLSAVSIHDVEDAPSPPGDPVPDPAATAVALAVRLGVPGLRAPMQTVRLARAFGGGTVTEDACACAAAFVLAPRATVLPDQAEAEPEAPAPTDARADGGTLEDRVVDAIRPALPADLLAGLTGRATGASGQGAGAARKGNRRGRPLPPLPGKPGQGARIDVVATLRQAAPWQRLRGGGPGRPVRLRAADIRVRRYETKSDRLVIFAVDASGSTAIARLAEAKGAVEVLLAQSYARRDHVALIGFRGERADLLLPPTRSLVRTKRELAALPGGGGTPLAAGLRDGAALGRQARARGMAPSLVVLTDGRPNVGLSGAHGRAAAMTDAEAMARHVRAEGLAGLVIDTGQRPSPALRGLAADMGADCLALPRADAASLGRAVAAVL